MAIRSCRIVSSTPSIHSVRRVFPSTAGSQPCPPAPFRNPSGLRLTQELPFIRFWPFRIQASGTAAVPTGPWLSTVYHVRACKRYYGLIRQSDELRPAWLYQLTLAGLCPCGRFASPSLLCFVILSIHAATSTPSADRVRLMAHPSVMGAFTIPIAVRLFRITLLTGFREGSNFGAAVFS